jgi:hypothetical protein
MDGERASSLKALAAGDLASFDGLGEADDRAAAEAAFGPSAPGPDGIGPLMGELLPFRRYDPAPVGPYGVVVWFGPDDAVLLVEVPSPALDAADLLPLGEPELDAPSRLEVFHKQLAWPSRGLAAHVSKADGSVRVLYAFGRLAPDEYSSWLGSVQGPQRVRRG